jgi:uncharacterized protein (TIGR00369 family)
MGLLKHMQIDEEHFRKLERMYHLAAPINQFFQPTLRVSNGAAELVMPVRPEFFHAANAIHGSVYFKALDDVAFFAVNSQVSDVFVLTQSYNIYLTRPVSEGIVRAVGRIVHRSRTLFLAEAELFDSHQRHVGRGSGSFVRSTIPLSPAIGYV